MRINIKQFKTTNNLPFEVAASPYRFRDDTHYHQMFRVGTCEGQWGCTEKSYFILSVINKSPGNGHLTDLFEWFEHSAKRDNKNLLVLCLANGGFKEHLINKKGFKPHGDDHVIKTFRAGIKCTDFITPEGKKGLIIDIK
ncbi:MAG: hypothetical protein V4547_17610 [Bacteroidota bacterium]